MNQQEMTARIAAGNGFIAALDQSGGYTRDEACAELARNHGMIASFSRALLDSLRVGMSDAEFDAALSEAIDAIHCASTQKLAA